MVCPSPQVFRNRTCIVRDIRSKQFSLYVCISLPGKENARLKIMGARSFGHLLIGDAVNYCQQSQRNCAFDSEESSDYAERPL